MYTHVYTYIHIYIYVYVYIYIRLCVHIYVPYKYVGFCKVQWPAEPLSTSLSSTFYLPLPDSKHPSNLNYWSIHEFIHLGCQNNHLNLSHMIPKWPNKIEGPNPLDILFLIPRPGDY